MARHRSKKKGICSDSVSNSHDHAAESCEVISKVLLSEDLMFYILTLVPISCLINSARYVCKPWAATIASSLFVEMCENRARSKPGLYVENTTTSSSYFLEFKDGVNGQFERTNLGTPQKMGHIISTCDGILLLWNSFVDDIFVVNPLLKCWLRIPPLTIYGQHEFRCRPQCAIVCVPGTIKFKLFIADILYISSGCWHVFYVLRIGIDNSWREIARKEYPFQHYLWEPLYNGGNDLYWMTKIEVIVMDVDKEIILREYPLPQVPSGEDPTYLLMENRLSCIVCKDRDYKTYNIYILDFDSRKWSFYYQMELFDCVTACGHKLISSEAFRLWIDDQIIFRVALRQNQSNIFQGFENMHFGYNVKTRQLTKIEDIDVGDFEVWLHANSLVSLSSAPP